MDKTTDIINPELFTSYYVDGKLKCEDCVYNHNECEVKFKRCMANVISPEGVTHLKWCERDYTDNMKAKILEVMELIHKK
jgi:hypothetical protein